MSLSPMPISPQVVEDIASQLQMLVEAQRATEIATLAAAIITAMNRPVSLNEVMEIRRDVEFTLYSTNRGSSSYKAWQEQRSSLFAAEYK